MGLHILCHANWHDVLNPMVDKESLNVTELLVTGFDGNDTVLAVNLGPDRATVVLTSTHDNGETTVDSSWEADPGEFWSVQEMLRRLTGTPVSVS